MFPLCTKRTVDLIFHVIGSYPHIELSALKNIFYFCSLLDIDGYNIKRYINRTKRINTTKEYWKMK